MTKYLQILCLWSLAVFAAASIMSAPVMAAQTAPLPNTAAAGYHPGLFSLGSSPPADQEPIPPVVNTYEGTRDEFPNVSSSVNCSFFPGDAIKGEGPSVAGYVSGTPLNTLVNISGRTQQTQQFQYLATVYPNDKGIFVWQVPEWASNLTEFIADIAY
ncbi:MAG: hypothetical protein CVV33_02320 [Methanomicrobiales archaeon HGW-Methanomicrobiales-4]|nr:MAG: hypothetical protein CVV33_02320 [Methanomicrobiales archaeon HGW-Methanomicrobiales-4]